MKDRLTIKVFNKIDTDNRLIIIDDRSTIMDNRLATSTGNLTNARLNIRINTKAINSIDDNWYFGSSNRLNTNLIIIILQLLRRN